MSNGRLCKPVVEKSKITFDLQPVFDLGTENPLDKCNRTTKIIDVLKSDFGLG